MALSFQPFFALGIAVEMPTRPVGQVGIAAYSPTRRGTPKNAL
jgi:hypothetical protein